MTDVTRLSTTLADVAWLMDASRRRKWALVSLAESVRSDDPALPFLSVVDAFAPVIAYVTFDCEEPESLADFWAAATGYRKESTPEPGEYAVLSDLSGRGPAIWFNKVPERKVVKNRVHLCLNVHAVDSEIERLVALGAEKSEQHTSSSGRKWVVMRDPEGNEFCLIPVTRQVAARLMSSGEPSISP